MHDIVARTPRTSCYPLYAWHQLTLAILYTLTQVYFIQVGPSFESEGMQTEPSAVSASDDNPLRLLDDEDLDFYDQSGTIVLYYVQ